MAVGVHGAGELRLVDCPSSHGALEAGTVHWGRVAGGGIRRAVLSQRGQGRVLRENLRQESRLETRKAVMSQRARCPSHSREQRLRRAGGQGAADEGDGTQVQTAARPRLRAGLAALLQVVQNRADGAGDQRADGGGRGCRDPAEQPPWSPLLQESH